MRTKENKKTVCYGILVYKSKFLLFCEFNLVKKDVYVNEAILQIFDLFIKFNYLIGPNILQLVFDFIVYSIVA